MTLRGALHALVALGLALGPALAGPMPAARPGPAVTQAPTPEAPGQPPKAAPGAERVAVAAPDRPDLPPPLSETPDTPRPGRFAGPALPRHTDPGAQRSDRPSARAPPEDIA